MNSLEDRITLLPDGGAAFSVWCLETFGSGCGHSVLELLCRLEHPLMTPNRGNDRDTLIAIGRIEVISLLFRRSQPQITPSEIPPPTTPAS